jgi:hypothetical protein
MQAAGAWVTCHHRLRDLEGPWQLRWHLHAKASSFIRSTHALPAQKQKDAAAAAAAGTQWLSAGAPLCIAECTSTLIAHGQHMQLCAASCQLHACCCGCFSPFTFITAAAAASMQLA